MSNYLEILHGVISDEVFKELHKFFFKKMPKLGTWPKSWNQYVKKPNFSWCHVTHFYKFSLIFRKTGKMLKKLGKFGYSPTNLIHFRINCNRWNYTCIGEIWFNIGKIGFVIGKIRFVIGFVKKGFLITKTGFVCQK